MLHLKKFPALYLSGFTVNLYLPYTPLTVQPYITLKWKQLQIALIWIMEITSLSSSLLLQRNLHCGSRNSMKFKSWQKYSAALFVKSLPHLSLWLLLTPTSFCFTPLLPICISPSLSSANSPPLFSISLSVCPSPSFNTFFLALIQRWPPCFPPGSSLLSLIIPPY